MQTRITTGWSQFKTPQGTVFAYKPEDDFLPIQYFHESAFPDGIPPMTHPVRASHGLIDEEHAKHPLVW